MQRETTTILDALDMFQLDCEARRLTPSTRQLYQAKRSIFLRWCDEHGTETFPDLTAHQIRRFLVHIQRRSHSGQF